MSNDNTLPSRFQINDEVCIRGVVSQVHFAEGKVHYVIDSMDSENSFHVDSAFVEPAPTVGGAIAKDAAA